MRRFKEPLLLIASQNKGKVKEISDLLAPFDTDVRSATGLNVAEPEENGKDFIENALIKAEYYSKASGLPALADDSGLCVEGLNGAPGIYSARWAKGGDFSVAMDRIEKELDGQDNLNAYFACALCLYWPDGHAESFFGTVKGTLTFPPRGDKGFGYDPIFIPEGYDITFGEMEYEKKQTISHRADAFSQLVKECFGGG